MSLYQNMRLDIHGGLNNVSDNHNFSKEFQLKILHLGFLKFLIYSWLNGSWTCLSFRLPWNVYKH